MLGHLKGAKTDAEDRTLILQSHRGEEPESWENATVITSQWKLVDNGKPDERELFDLTKDPYALKNVIGEFPGVRQLLESRYDAWLSEMRRINPMDLPLYVGTEYETEVVLTNQDAKEIDAKERSSDWRLNVAKSGAYAIGFSDKTFEGPVTVDLFVDDELVATQSVPGEKERYTFGSVDLEEGRRTLRAVRRDGESRFLHVYLSKNN